MSAKICQEVFSVCYTIICMRKKKRSKILFVLSIISFITLAYVIFFYPPSWKFEIGNWKFEILPVFFLLLFTFCFSLFSYILKSLRRGTLIGIFAVSYLLLRLFGLTHQLFLVLLAALFLTIELFFSYRQ